MLHVPASDFADAVSASPPAPSLAKLHAWQYLRLRREAAGLSIDDVATTLSPRISMRSDTAAWIRLLETRNVKARKMRPIKRLATVFPLDVSVYQQLAWGDRDRDPPVCRGCGCSFWDPARGGTIGAVIWDTPGTCDTCAASQAQAA